MNKCLTNQGLELDCGQFEKANDILNELNKTLFKSGKGSADPLIILSLPVDTDSNSRLAVIEAVQQLKSTSKIVRVVIRLPDYFDGTNFHQKESNPATQAIDLTTKLNRGLNDMSGTCWVLTLSDQSVWRLDSVYSLARIHKICVLIQRPTKPMTAHAQLFAWDFVTYFLLGERNSENSPPAINYFKALQKELSVFAMGNNYTPQSSLTSDAQFLATLLHLAHTEAFLIPTAQPVKAAEASEFLIHLTKAHISAFRARLSPGNRKNIMPHRLANVLLIGAYGGEHIGDVAILGGVLLRLHQNFGVDSAVLMTQRPNHTKRLVDQLNTPVSLSVAEYTFAEIDKQIIQADALVHAGGPLTDIPKQLVRHLYAAAKTKLANKTYWMEGVGPTTFKRSVSCITARTLVKLADRIVVRTHQDAPRKIIQGANITVDKDPAFDFLATLGRNLGNISNTEHCEIETLLKNKSNRPVIGINIRPINDLFTPTRRGQNRLQSTRAIEEQMERNLANGITRFDSECANKPIFIFFPMNAIQFGKSDNTSAFRIKARLPSHIDARVWHTDASLEAVVYLIRNLDTVIAMRFHAAIFSLSQNCPTIGIDYRIGMKYKVSAVMEDNGQADYCCRIDELECSWIAEKLHARIGSKKPT